MQTRSWKLHYKFNILLHALAWLGFLSLPILFVGSGNEGGPKIFQRWEFWFFGLCFIVPYYLNSYLWTPYVIRKKKYLLYLISVTLVCVVFALWLRPFDRLMQLNVPPQNQAFERGPAPPPLQREGLQGEQRPSSLRSPGVPGPRGRRSQVDIASLYIVMLVIILGSLIRMVQYWIKSQQKIQEVQHEWTRTQLAFLKAQVHPHFLFNTLNNLYALALTGDVSTATGIHKLSQLMRYYMDERNEGEVDLKEEVQAIQDFISLQKLRIGPNCKLVERYEGLEIPKKIYPFILLPFIENAFKYGLRISDPCYLDFYIQVKGDCCLMEVRNSIAAELTEQKGSGTGLKNTRKLLEHLYPGKFKLDIGQGNDEFFVRLLLYI
ncbi:MAG TPA: sensor histidine kinase [Flavitalea sp.]|nr:sensor histidine kinase [Flavitalea sp.]